MSGAGKGRILPWFTSRQGARSVAAPPLSPETPVSLCRYLPADEGGPMADEPPAPVPAGTEPMGPCPTAATPPQRGPATDAQAAPLRMCACPTLLPWPCGALRKSRKLIKEMQQVRVSRAAKPLGIRFHLWARVRTQRSWLFISFHGKSLFSLSSVSFRPGLAKL